jgi:molybdopterin converting factor small subunit
MISILLFGELADLAGDAKISFEEVNDTDALKEAIYNRYPALKAKSFLIAVDKHIVTEKTAIGKGAEIALLPPFSGG